MIASCWDDAEKSIIRHDFQGKWTWKEFFDAEVLANEMASSVPHRVDIIANMRAGYMPPDNALANARALILRRTPNQGVIVVVVNPLLSMTIKIFKQVDTDFDKAVRAADSVNEAREAIKRERELFPLPLEASPK